MGGEIMSTSKAKKPELIKVVVKKPVAAQSKCRYSGTVNM